MLLYTRVAVQPFTQRLMSKFATVSSSMIKPQLNQTYVIELCSGEERRWRFLGPDSRSQIWWCDLETEREFNETSVMYSWQIVRKEGPSSQQ